MPADRNPLSGLLYLPSEELVRSTVEGDASDWSESLDYVPNEALVDHVLLRSRAFGHNDAPVFRFPPAIERAAWAQRQPVGRRRAASAVAAILGVSPTVLAAATIAHAAAFAALGQWIFQQVGAAAAIPTPVAPAVQMHSVVYWPLRAPAPHATMHKTRLIRVTTPGPRLTVAESGFRGVVRFDTTAVAVSQQHEIPLRREKGRGADTAAFREEFLFEGNDLHLTTQDRFRVATLIRLLRMLPESRLRIFGGGPAVSADDSLGRGLREAEAFARVLVQEHIDRARLDLDTIPRAEQMCPEREPMCARGRSRVITQLLRSTPPR